MSMRRSCLLYTSSGKTIQILVAAARKKQQGEEFVEIKIEDNGIGFSDNVLESLRQDKDIVTEKGTRIGIRNCIPVSYTHLRLPDR